MGVSSCDACGCDDVVEGCARTLLTAAGATYKNRGARFHAAKGGETDNGILMITIY